MKFRRYGTRRYVGYTADRVPIIDVDNPNRLSGYSLFRGTASRPVYWIDWGTGICQAVWSVNTPMDVKHYSRVIPNWEEEKLRV